MSITGKKWTGAHDKWGERQTWSLLVQVQRDLQPQPVQKSWTPGFFLGELYHQSTLVFQKKNSEISSNFYHPDISPLKLAIFLGYSNAVATGD